MVAIGRSLLLFLLVTLIACDSPQRRPPGYFRLGKISDLRIPEKYIANDKLFVRFDGKGFSVMSTACTYDLSALVRVQRGDHYQWESSYTASKYADDGHVISGPAKFDLPFYKIDIDASAYGGKPDTLFAEVGDEEGRDYRFFPEE